VDAFEDLGVDSVARKLVVDVDTFDNEHLAVELDLADGFADQLAVTCVYPARLQRAPEGAGQSPTRRGDDVIERRRVGRIILGRDAVVCGDLGVDSKGDRVLSAGHARLP
jgi:hypothetical protein